MKQRGLWLQVACTGTPLKQSRSRYPKFPEPKERQMSPVQIHREAKTAASHYAKCRHVITCDSRGSAESWHPLERWQNSHS
jgi:hypothetical protein